MKFFVDTADIDQICDLAASGLLDGVTTNPSLIAKAGATLLADWQTTGPSVLGPSEAV